MVTAKVILQNAPYQFQIWLDKYSPLCSHVDYFGGDFRSLNEYLKALEIIRNQLKLVFLSDQGWLGSGKRGAVVLDNVNITHITEVMITMAMISCFQVVTE